MKVIIPVNGKNERVGQLFTIPKHLLLYNGIAIIDRIIKFFEGYDITILTNDNYIQELEKRDVNIINVGQTESQVETILKGCKNIKDSVLFCDCDIIPINLTIHHTNTVYCFKNDTNINQYSNFAVKNDYIVDCNEKKQILDFCGAGIYVFESFEKFRTFALNEKSISNVIKKMVEKGENVKVDTRNYIKRFGTLKDITG